MSSLQSGPRTCASAPINSGEQCGHHRRAEPWLPPRRHHRDNEAARPIHTPLSTSGANSPVIGVSSCDIRWPLPSYNCFRSLSMTSKPPAISPGSAGSIALALRPPSIDLSSKLLSSTIPLPPNASIGYAIFSPTTPSTLHSDTIEGARKRVIDTGKPSLLDSLLCTVHVEKGGQQLFVFSVVTSDGANDPFGTLRSLQFDGLICESSECVIQPLHVMHLDTFLAYSFLVCRTVLTFLPP